jgi:hypothetical protein
MDQDQFDKENQVLKKQEHLMAKKNKKYQKLIFFKKDFTSL